MTTSSTPNLYLKHQRLQHILAGVGRSVIAFSGGTSSSLLLWAAAEEVGRSQVLAVIAPEDGLTPEAVAQAERTARRLGLCYRIVQSANECASHCPACHLSLYARLAEIREEERYASLLDGCQADAQEERPPGPWPAQEFGVRSPLAEAGLDREEVQALARALGLVASTPLPAAAPPEPAPAPPPASALTVAEAYLRSLGFRHARLRLHGEVVRIEVGPEEVHHLATAGVRLRVTRCLRELGFPYAAIDLPDRPRPPRPARF